MAHGSAEQLQQETQQEIAAQSAARSQHLQLRSRGLESQTPYGAAMLRAHGETVRDALELLLAQWAARPGMAGPHFCALPLLLHFAGRGGPAAIVATALPVVIDAISQRRPHRRLAKDIGAALELEIRGARLQERRQSTLRLMKRAGLKAKATDLATLATMGIEAPPWSATDRFEVGALLLDLIAAATGLVVLATVKVGGRRSREVAPAPATLAAIKATPARRLPVVRLPMLEPPRPWAGLEGGGHLGNTRPLCGRTPYLQGLAIPTQLAVVNQLQRQRMVVVPEMVALQSDAWDQGLDLWPVSREPLAVPPRPDPPTRETLAAWHLIREAGLADRRQGLPMRLKIHRSLTSMRELAGRPCWFAYELDWRGRIYTAQRVGTHQGPDWEKAAIELQGEPAGEDGFEWMLKAAAGHWGERGTWAQRLAWGNANLELLTAAAEAPLDRADLWRDAKDPWQFLQLCRAIHQWLQDPTVPIGCPIRLDQHASGMAHVAALTRNRKLAAATRVIGDAPVDLYGLIAELVVQRLRLDLEAGPPHLQREAAEWLEIGITRSTLKGPTMTTVYGAGFWSVADGLAIELQGRKQAWPSQYERELVKPSQYLARHINAVLKQELAGCFAVRAWLKQLCRAVVAQQQPVRWTTPMGFPVVLGAEQQQRAPVPTAVSGSRRWAATHATPGELSARATGRGIMPNLIHSFDAALCQAVICRAGEQRMELLTNHDCFAAIPSRAGQLHQMLHDELRQLYRTSWLPKINREIETATGIELPAPPIVGSLAPGEIGLNPYAFS